MERIVGRLEDQLQARGLVPQSQISKRALISYFIDYAIVIVLAAIYALLDKIVTPFNQPFSLTNISLQYPYADPERIPIWLALVISGLFPAATIAVYTLFIDGLFSRQNRVTRARSKYSVWDRLWELNCGWLGLLLAQGSAFVITGSLKNLAGKPRPDIIARCKPVADAVRNGLELVTREVCTETDSHIMQDGFRSFPSGHSSSSFAGLFFLSLYLAAKLHVLDNRGEVWRTFVVFIPTVAAACVAVSRIMDARHHPFDVLFGSALGILCAWGSYRQYFPPVSHVWEKGRAYPMRTWGKGVRQPVRGRVLVDAETLEVLENQLDDDSGDNYELDRSVGSGTGFDSRANTGPAARLYMPNQGFASEGDTGYPGAKLQSSMQGGPQAQASNTFRDQVAQNRRLRGESPPGGGSEDESLSATRPLQH